MDWARVVDDERAAVSAVGDLLVYTTMQCTAIFHGCKNGNFQIENCNICLIFAQNIDREYTLEPPH